MFEARIAPKASKIIDSLSLNFHLLSPFQQGLLPRGNGRLVEPPDLEHNAESVLGGHGEAAAVQVAEKGQKETFLI